MLHIGWHAADVRLGFFDGQLHAKLYSLSICLTVSISHCRGNILQMNVTVIATVRWTAGKCHLFAVLHTEQEFYS